MHKDEEIEREDRSRGNAAGIALDWLDQHYEKEMDEIVRQDFLGVFDEQILAAMPEGLLEMAIVNAREYALCEGRVSKDGVLVPTLDLVLGVGGPLMEAGQRQYLQTLREASLSLYEVVSVQRDYGLELRDMVDDSLAPRQVVDRQASRVFEAGDVFGVRVVPGRPWELSGAIYELDYEEAVEILQALREEIAEAPPGFDRRFLQGKLIVDFWLSSLIVMPPAVLTPDGDPLLLITDHYRLKDRQGFIAALEVEPDVDGDGKSTWSRLEDPEAEFLRPILSINPGKSDDRIETFARTQKMADEGKEWFQKVAGATVEYITREIVDPTSPGALAAAGGSGTGPEPFDMSQLPEGFLQNYMEKKIYADWADVPIPALDGKTPREAVASEEGKQRVIDLLQSYRRDQEKQAREPGSQTVDFTFLWNELGLEAPNV